MDQTTRLQPLTSLRFVAAMMIVALHSSNYFPDAAMFRSVPLHHGVSFFFVLSGFILSHAYSNRQTDYWAFLGSRFARLWPTHLVTLLAVLFFIRADSRQFPGTGFFDPIVVFISNLTLTQSLVPYINYTFSWNSVSWSISTEMFFYIAFPFLLVGFNKNWPIKIAISIAFIGLYAVIAQAFHIPVASVELTDLTVTYMTYASPLFRGFEFVLGMLVYLGWRRLVQTEFKIGTTLEIAAVALLIYWMIDGIYRFNFLFNWNGTINLWYGNSGSAFVCAIVIFVFAGGTGLLGRFLSLRPLIWLGEISFALYMCHQIIMKWMWLKSLEGKLTLPPVWVGVLLCIAVAALLHHQVELRAQKFLKQLGRKMRSGRTVAVLHAQGRHEVVEADGVSRPS